MKEWKIAVIIAAIVISVVLVLVLLLPKLQAVQRITQVRLRVEYSGVWAGSYTINSGLQNWYGIGNTTITLNRNNVSESWQVSADVRKNDFASGVLRLSIIGLDGQVIEESTIAYNDISSIASVSHTFG